VPPRLDPRTAQTVGVALGFGWRIAAGVLLGYWLDGRLETAPIFLTVFAIAALTGSIYDMLRVSRRKSGGPGERDQP
jgi:F0F1-type ATP synthase assembly protein I